MDKATFLKLHRQYLQQSLPQMYLRLQKKGDLGQHLQEVADEAMRMYDQISEDLAVERNKLPEAKKLQALENIPHVALEVVLAEVVYQPRA